MTGLASLALLLWGAMAIIAGLIVWVFLHQAHNHNGMSRTWNALAYLVRALRRLSAWLGHVALALNAALELYHFDHRAENIGDMLPAELRLPRGNETPVEETEP